MLIPLQYSKRNYVLALRLRQHEENSIKIAQWLSQRSEVKAVAQFLLYQVALVMKILNKLSLEQAAYFRIKAKTHHTSVRKFHESF